MKLRSWLVQRVAVNVAITDYVKARQALPRTEVIYHGIEDLSKAPRKVTMEVSPIIKPVIVYVGRFVREKGISALLHGAKLLAAEGQDFELRLIGDGSLRSEIEEEVARLGLQRCVTITGFLAGNGLDLAIEGAAAVVMPSVWEEAAGLAAIEQMMRGKLVVASAIGGLQEVLGDAGITFPAGDARALADRLRTVLQNPGLGRQLGEKARVRATMFFGRQRMIEEHAKVYRRLLIRGEGSK